MSPEQLHVISGQNTCQQIAPHVDRDKEPINIWSGYDEADFAIIKRRTDSGYMASKASILRLNESKLEKKVKKLVSSRM